METLLMNSMDLPIKIFNRYHFFTTAYLYIERFYNGDDKTKSNLVINYMYKARGEIKEMSVERIISLKSTLLIFKKIGINAEADRYLNEEQYDTANRILSDIVFYNNSLIENEDYTTFIDECVGYNNYHNQTYAEAIESLNRQAIRRDSNGLLPHFYNNTINNDYKLKIFNVGQANMSVLYENDKIKVIFDLGNKRTNFNPLSEFSDDNLHDDGYVVISHYDDDHINYIKKLMNSKILNWTFIVPEPPIKKRNNSTYVLLTNIKKRKIEIPDSLLGRDLLDFGLFKLNQGDPNKMSKFQSTKENAHSLVSYLEFNGKNVMIPGDALYEEFYIPSKIYDLVLVAHHGCYYTTINPMPIINNSILLCKVPCHKGYKHPSTNHLVLLHSNIIRFGDQKCNFLMFDNSKNIINDNITQKMIHDDFEYNF